MDWKKEFLKPNKEYGIYPLIHNDVLNYKEKLSKHTEKGWGGVVTNIKYESDFLESKEPWQNVAEGCKAYINNGMKIWIYDEKGYPSGTAGGAVLEHNPDFEATGLICYQYANTITGPRSFRSDTPEGKLFKVFLVPTDATKETVDVTNSVNEAGTLNFEIPESSYKLVIFVIRRIFDSTHASRSFSEPRRYVDLFNAQATKTFLDVTHEKYKDVLGDEFGKNVTAFFTDEPSLIGWHITDYPYPMVSWNKDFPEEFLKKYGYPIEEALISVFFNGTSLSIKHRCDFWDFTAEKVATGYFKVIQDWCHKNNIKSSGHLLDEEHLLSHIYCYGSYYRSAKYLDWPGIDELGCNPVDLMSTEIIPIARLSASFADVYDLENAQSEASAIAQSWSKIKPPLEWIKASVNWHQAQGINIITSYFDFSHFSTEDIANLNTYTARVGTLLRQGKRDSKVAVLYPENAMWASYVPTEKSRNKGQCKTALQIENCFTKISWELLNRQIDFDYIDENEICNATLSENTLNVLTRKYNIIILPCAYVMSEKTVKQLCAFMDNGGTVITIDRLPEYARENGASTEIFKTLLTYQSKNSLLFTSIEEFDKISKAIPRTIELIPSTTPPTIRVAEDGLISHYILSHIRKDDDKTVVFLCNMGYIKYEGKVNLPPCNEVLIANPNTGEIEPAELIIEDETAFAQIEIAQYDGMFLIIK